MITVAVAGAAGRMGRLVAATVAGATDLELGALYDPGGVGDLVAGMAISADPESIAGCDVVVEFTTPGVVMANLESWKRLAVHAVVGTSGFDEARLEDVRRTWGPGPPNCLIVPNFSIGAIVMMRLAELAAPHFSAGEVIEYHHDNKVDAPSGTAMETARRMSIAAGTQHRAVESAELVAGARGADIDGVSVHSVRLAGYVAHQTVMLGQPGETLSIRHDTTDRMAFMPGVLLGIRTVAGLEEGVTVGLGGLVDLDPAQ